MGRTAGLDAQVNHVFLRKEFVEDGDGDFILHHKVTADCFDACRLANKELIEKCETPRTNWRWSDRQWVFKNGKWETSYFVYVDGIEYALERQNDYIASMREDPREEAMERELEANYEWEAERNAHLTLTAQIGVAF